MKKLLMIPALLAAGIMYGQTYGATWQDVSPYLAGSPVALDGGTGVTYDASGNVYTVGNYSNSTTIGTTSLTNLGTGRDIFVAKYSATGGFLGAVRLGSSSDDEGYSIAWKDNYLFVSGYVNGQGMIYKLNDNSALSTVISRNLGSEVHPRSIFSYGTNRLMVGGSFLQLCSLPSSSNTTIDMFASNINSSDCASGCYDSFTGIIDMSAYFLYVGNPYSSTKSNEIMAIHCRNGYIYCTGYFKGSMQWKSTGANMTAAGVQDMFAASVYMSGSLNQCTFDADQMQAGSIETQPAGAAGLLPDWKECGYGIAVNGTAIYVTGNLNNASTPLFDGSAYSGSGAFVARINYSGSQLGTVSWVRASSDCSSGAAVTKSIGYGIAYDASGNVWATGSAYANVKMAGGSNSSLCVGTGSERPGFICRYDASGNLLSLDQINQKTTTGMRCEGKSIAANGCNMATTGWVASATFFAAGALPQENVSGTGCSAYIFGFNREATISNSIYTCTTCSAFPLTGSMSAAATGATAYAWSPTTYLTNYNTATPTYSITTCNTAINNYSVTITSSVCPTVSIPFTLATVVQSSANAGADMQVCPNVPYTLGTAAVPGYTYSWSPITNLGNTYNSAQPTYTNTTTLTSPFTYQVTATDLCGNVTVDYVVLSNGSCRMANPHEITAQVFPNPSAGIFTLNISATDEDQNVELTVTDLAGRTVQQTTTYTSGGAMEIDLSAQPKGVYMLSVTRNGVTEVHRLVVE